MIRGGLIFLMVLLEFYFVWTSQIITLCLFAWQKFLTKQQIDSFVLKVLGY
jgi:hypothetical protein